MKLRWRSTLGLFAISGAVVLAACGDDDDGTSPSGGTAGVGGSTAGNSTGGTAGTPSGGAAAGTATGGTAGKAGSGSGGTAGKGGTAGNAGSAGEGGTGEGGAGNEACTTTVDGLLLHAFDVPGTLAGWSVKTNLGTPPDSQLGDASIARDPAVGHTCPGSLRLDVPFSAYSADNSASVTAEINYSPAKAFPYEAPEGAGGAGAGGAGAGGDAAGGDGAGGAGSDGTWPVLHAWVKVENTAKNVQFLGGAQPYVNTAAYTKYANKFHNVDASWNDGSWHELVLDFATVCSSGGYCSDGMPDPATVLQLGVEFIVRKVAADGAPAAPTASKIYIDDIWVE